MRELSLSLPAGVRVVPDQHSGIGVLTLAGSSGRIDADRARLFARHGAVAESVQWFGGPGQNPGPWEIPLELFQARIADLRRSCDRIVVVGMSLTRSRIVELAGRSPPRSSRTRPPVIEQSFQERPPRRQECIWLAAARLPLIAGWARRHGKASAS